MAYIRALQAPLTLQTLPVNAHVCGTTTFLWEGLRLLSEQRHGIDMLYVYEDADSYAPLARIDSVNGKQSIFYFQCQPNGLPDALADSEGNIQWHARFTSWGKTEIELGNLHSGGQKRSQNLRFQGQYFDRETGLHYNTFRYYDPDIGRFTQPDPIGLAGGLNLYQYAPNGLGWIDPWGLHKNRNDWTGDWVLYDVIDTKTGERAKTGIGKADDKLADGRTNRRAHTSARKVQKDPNFKNAKATVVETYEGITKGQMKDIEAKRVRELREQGHSLPHNKERDKRYKPGKGCGLK